MIESARLFLGRVLVVDDGSTDDTARRAEQAGAEVLLLGSNQGKGAALSAGLARARSLGFGWAATLDGDGQHDPAELPGLFRASAGPGVRLVIGNRMADCRAMPRVRRWTNRLMSRSLSWACGRPLPDTQCGMRLIELNAWSGLPMRSRGFEIESECLVRFLAEGYGVVFVPVRTIYTGRPSKIAAVPDTVRWLRWAGASWRLFGEARRRRGRVASVGEKPLEAEPERWVERR